MYNPGTGRRERVFEIKKDESGRTDEICELSLVMLEGQCRTRRKTSMEQNSHMTISRTVVSVTGDETVKAEYESFEPTALLLGGGESGALHVWGIGQFTHRYLRRISAHRVGVAFLSCLELSAETESVTSSPLSMSRCILSASTEGEFKVWKCTLTQKTIPVVSMDSSTSKFATQTENTWSLCGYFSTQQSSKIRTELVSALVLPSSANVACGLNDGDLQIWDIPWGVTGIGSSRKPVCEAKAHTFNSSIVALDTTDEREPEESRRKSKQVQSLLSSSHFRCIV